MSVMMCTNVYMFCFFLQVRPSTHHIQSIRAAVCTTVRVDKTGKHKSQILYCNSGCTYSYNMYISHDMIRILNVISYLLWYMIPRTYVISYIRRFGVRSVY